MPSNASRENFERDGNETSIAGEDLLNRLDRAWGDLPPDSLDQSCPSSSPLQTASVPSWVAHYRIIRVLGSGGFGIVYLARDEELNRLVALKLPRIEVWNDMLKWPRFVAEAELASKLSHSGIVPVYHAELNSATPFIASQFCDGPNLAQWLAAHKPRADWRQCCRVIAKLAMAVDFAHQQGIVHRDLKPANIMLSPPTSRSTTSTEADPLKTSTADRSNQDLATNFRSPTLLELDQYSPKLTDFGLAKLIEPSSSKHAPSGLLLGSPHYMAPEQIDARTAASPATDIYSLGVILFELLSGDLPITGDSPISLVDNIRCSPPRKLQSTNETLPASLIRICDNCLQKDPQQRYRSAGELANDLLRCIDNQPLIKRKSNHWGSVVAWHSNPQRVSNAGWFSLIWSTIFLFWMITAILALPSQIEISRPAWTKLIFELGWAVVFSWTPMILLNWYTIKRYRWAVYGGTLLSALKLPFYIRAMLVEPIYFKSLFRDLGVYAFGLHFLLALLLTIQLALYCCAALATARQVSD